MGRQAPREEQCRFARPCSLTPRALRTQPSWCALVCWRALVCQAELLIQGCLPLQVVAVLFALVASCSAFVAPVSPLRASAASGLTMKAEGSSSRREMLAGLLIGAAAMPAAASAVVPGLTGPGLVPAPKKSGGRPEWESIRDASSFWSPKGIMDSVPKVKGIITPKTPVK